MGEGGGVQFEGILKKRGGGGGGGGRSEADHHLHNARMHCEDDDLPLLSTLNAVLNGFKVNLLQNYVWEKKGLFRTL